MRQPNNRLAPWEVISENSYVGVDDNGLRASQIVVEKVVFKDGTVLTTVNSGGFSNPDMGTF